MNTINKHNVTPNKTINIIAIINHDDDDELNSDLSILAISLSPLYSSTR